MLSTIIVNIFLTLSKKVFQDSMIHGMARHGSLISYDDTQDVTLCKITGFSRPGEVARSEACSLGMQAAASLIPMSGTFFRGDLVMKTFLRPFSLFR